LSVIQAAAFLNRKTIYRLIDRGELRAVHVGSVLRVSPRELGAYLERE
jgi:excisionase family DNA binding protein